MKRLASVVLLFSTLFAPMAGFGAAPRSGTGEKVIIGLPTTSMSMLPVFFAHDKGFFREEGIEPQLVFVGGRLQVPALVAGEVDFSASAETVLRAAVQGMPLKVVVYMNSRMAVSLMAAPDIKTIASLKGSPSPRTPIRGSLTTVRGNFVNNGLIRNENAPPYRHRAKRADARFIRRLDSRRHANSALRCDDGKERLQAPGIRWRCSRLPTGRSGDHR